MTIPATSCRPFARRRLLALLAAGAVGLGGPAASAEPDAGALGEALGYPVGSSPTDWYGVPKRVGSWSAMDRVPGLPTRPVSHGATPAADLPAMTAPPPIRYAFRGRDYTLDDYLERQRVTGLLILKDGAIVAERYRYGRTADARFLSFSMAKSVTSLLVGVALEQGAIASLDDVAGKYAPELAGSAYGATSIRHLLRMGSGLVFSELYDGKDDMARLSRAANGAAPGVVGVLRSVDQRRAPPGTTFAYASAESAVLGRVLAGATGRDLAALSAEWLWQPLGAERDAFWVLASDGHELAHSGFNATLRDWGRLGRLLARDGRAGDRQVVPRDYLLDATDAARQPAAFQPHVATPFLGYGYQFWLLPMRERTFALLGVHGQAVYVQPATGIVMVQTAVYTEASGRTDPLPYEERSRFWIGVLKSLGGASDLF